MNSIEQYNPYNIIYKQNLFEKNNFVINLFLKEIKFSGWNEIIYLDKDIVVVFNNISTTFMCVTVDLMSKVEFNNLQVSIKNNELTPTLFSSTKDFQNSTLDNTEEQFLTSEIYFYFQLQEATKKLKIPKICAVYNHIIIAMFQKISSVKTLKQEYKNNYKSFANFKESLLDIETELTDDIDDFIIEIHNWN